MNKRADSTMASMAPKSPTIPDRWPDGDSLSRTEEQAYEWGWYDAMAVRAGAPPNDPFNAPRNGLLGTKRHITDGAAQKVLDVIMKYTSDFGHAAISEVWDALHDFRRSCEALRGPAPGGGSPPQEECASLRENARELVDAADAVRREMEEAGQRGDLRTNSQMASWARYEKARQVWNELAITLAASPAGVARPGEDAPPPTLREALEQIAEAPGGMQDERLANVRQIARDALDKQPWSPELIAAQKSFYHPLLTVERWIDSLSNLNPDPSLVAQLATELAKPRSNVTRREALQKGLREIFADWRDRWDTRLADYGFGGGPTPSREQPPHD